MSHPLARSILDAFSAGAVWPQAAPIATIPTSILQFKVASPLPMRPKKTGESFYRPASHAAIQSVADDRSPERQSRRPGGQWPGARDRPEFDDAEAGMVIGRIERCTVTTVDREGINYRIEMKVPGARVAHVLRMPTAKEMQDHERASTSIVAARRSVETRAFLEPSGALYDKLHVAHEGYAGAVPIVHKSAAVPGPGRSGEGRASR